jgi:two-component system, cell cycle sensor histidine kinase and response regulator CckA
MLAILWTHAAAIFLFVAIRDGDVPHALLEGGAVAVAGAVAAFGQGSRRRRALAACVGLLTSSAILVHLSGGYIEFHFHFFVMVPLMALYQDWVPFLAAIAYVVVHHGVVGVLAPGDVYNHAAAWSAPWTWAAIHGAFVLGASVVSCVTWRLNEVAAADAAASARRFHDLVQSLDAVVWEADADMRRFTFVSRQTERMFGYPVTRWLEEPGFWPKTVHPDDRARAIAAYAMLAERGLHHQLEYRLVAADGRAVQVSDVVHVCRDDLGVARTFSGVMVDITEQRSLEAQLRQSQKMEAIGRLAGGVAHDFNNLLSVVIGRTQMLLDERPELHRELSLIESTAERAAALTRQLLAFGRKQSREPRVLELGAVLTGLEPMLRRVIREDIELAVRPHPGGAYVEVDPVQIEQIVLNLVVNARDAMPAGGRLIIEVADEAADRSAGSGDDAAGRRVALVVSDTGVGMHPSTLAHMFEPFFTTKQPGEGTGLGLATVYGIVTQSGGEIGVESAPGHGTRFTIHLPRVDRPAATTAAAPGPAALMGGTETILLVEDEPAVRALVRDVLVEWGYRVIAAASGDEALRLARSVETPIDLLLTDVIMPRMNGSALATRLVAARPGLKVLYMSGYSGETLLRDSGTPLLPKPVIPAALIAKVREVLARDGAGGLPATRAGLASASTAPRLASR